MDCLFNSCDTYYKRPFGALPAGQTVHMALCIPEQMGYVDPHLVLQKEGPRDQPVYYRMRFDGQTPGVNHFSVDVQVFDVDCTFIILICTPTSARSTGARWAAGCCPGRRGSAGS